MLARVLSAALSAIAPASATAEVHGIEAFPVEAEVNSGWGDTTVVIVRNNVTDHFKTSQSGSNQNRPP